MFALMPRMAFNTASFILFFCFESWAQVRLSTNASFSSTGSDIVMTTTGTTRITINSVGNVGVGSAASSMTMNVGGAIKLGSMTACGATEEGSQRYNSSLKIMEFCNGTSWQAIGGTTIPSGAVMAFDLASCPSGWTTFAGAAGRVIVGVGNNGETNYALNNSGGAENISLTVAQMPAHTHTIDPPSTATSSSGAHVHTVTRLSHPSRSLSTPGGSGGAIETDSSSDGAHTHTLDIAPFTSGSNGSGSAVNVRQPYRALLYCEKN